MTGMSFSLSASLTARVCNEARRKRPDRVHKLGRTSNITTDAAICLSECASNDVNAVLNGSLGSAGLVRFEIEMLSDTSAMWSVHAYSMNFIEKGDRSVLLGKVADLFDGANRTTHAVHALECNDLGVLGRDGLELRFKISDIVMLEYHLLGARVSNTLNHRGMVQAVGKDNAVGQLAP
jgi:hypothetical protein